MAAEQGVQEGVVGKYDVDKKKELHLVQCPSGTGLYMFRFQGGGELPQDLKGKFTGRNTADIAVAVYLENIELLKINKKSK